MNITFDLNKATVYIPSGKMMNLKSQLRWDSIDFTPDEFKQSLLALYIKKYDEDFNFDKLQAHLIKQSIIDNEAERKSIYKKLLSESLIDLKFLKDKKIVVSMPQVLDGAVSMVKSNPQVQEKLLKLQKLKLINS